MPRHGESTVQCHENGTVTVLHQRLTLDLVLEIRIAKRNSSPANATVGRLHQPVGCADIHDAVDDQSPVNAYWDVSRNSRWPIATRLPGPATAVISRVKDPCVFAQQKESSG